MMLFAAPSAGMAGLVIDPLSWDGIATILAALIGATVVVVGFFVARRSSTRERRAAVFAAALQAVEDYAEAPFLILRRDDTIAGRSELSRHISDVQSRLALQVSLIRLTASDDLLREFDSLIVELRKTAGVEMTRAWSTRPIKSSRSIPLEKRYDRSSIDSRIQRVTDAMKQALR